MAHTHDNEDSTEKRIGIAFFTNLVFTIIEFIGGLYTNSIAIITDALHDLGDSLSLGLAYILEKISKRKHKRFSYGLRRISLLSSIILGISLFTASLFVVVEAVERLISPEPVKEEGMIILALLGIAVNGYAFFLTHKGKTFNERMVSLHMLEDVLGWIGVLIIAVITYFTEIYFLDAILSLIFVGIIIYNISKNIKEAAYIFLQAVPKEVDLENLKHLMLSIEGVVDVHDLHLWSLDGNRNILTAHVVVGKDQCRDVEDIKRNVKAVLRKEGVDHTTLEFEIEEDNMCDENCS